MLIGPPHSGKSSLLTATTHAAVKVADYPFTTVVPQPGMWEKDDVQIELVDTPPFTAEHVPTGLMGTIRNADLVCVVVEAGETALDQVEMVLGVLSARGLSLRSAPRNELSAGDPSQRAGLIVATKADLAPPKDIEALRELYAGKAGQRREDSGSQPSNTPCSERRLRRRADRVLLEANLRPDQSRRTQRWEWPGARAAAAAALLRQSQTAA